MRIGKFADTNKLSIDTIRHYMDFGLIVPEKQGGQYWFDEKCQDDLEEILSLKSLGFTLNEVKTIFMFRRLGKLTPYQEDEYYRDIFISKFSGIEKQIRELSDIKCRLDRKIHELSQKENKKQFVLGVDIKILDLFKCLKCGSSLTLSKGSISNNQIIDGELCCNCGEIYSIESGILHAGSSQRGTDENHSWFNLSEYISETDATYLDSIYKGLDWASKKLDDMELDNKILLELGTGEGFFLRNVYSALPENCFYIAVDHDIERHRFLKNMLERAECKRNVLFICSDFLEMPIKYNSVDILLDMSGTSNYSFEHEEFLLRLIDRYIKEDAYLLGTYILFKNFDVNTLIDKKFRKNFLLEHIKREIYELQYRPLDECTSEYLDRGGKYESYFKNGERVYGYRFYGKR